jgi:hypothetical protein
MERKAPCFEFWRTFSKRTSKSILGKGNVLVKHYNRNIVCLGMALKDSGPKWDGDYVYSFWENQAMSKSWMIEYKVSVGWDRYRIRSSSWRLDHEET